ncbi:3'-5' exonuclease [Actinomadura mexicana]|uniref:Inhibitor of the KinA pathway to sporulation, predicted exonuclease n=1 Tax=Actinomadura mexicana TaxID=134959 RepID=A0A238X365_9ACTN|nr:3'-5' exonuclease [Actinomadura mexicana]SNR52279.1 Inhibitor of the KinA pathway to sporulation, predicted exonuclease [Actinomadura mexicana]
MERFGQFLNVVDVEATCWDGPPPPGQASEIIEIGLCVVDVESRTRVAKHRFLVRPVRSVVSAFCTELTGLTQAEVESGVEFREACALLEQEHRSRSRAWASWGDYDRKQFERQCSAGRVSYPFSSRHTNAKQAFTDCFGLQRRLGMSAALDHAGLALEGRHHSGADDAWNIAALILEIMSREGWRTGAF